VTDPAPLLDHLPEVHGAIAAACLFAYHKLGDEDIAKSLQGFDRVYTTLKQSISDALSDQVSPVFREAFERAIQPSVIVNAQGVPTTSITTAGFDVTKGEAYREALRAYVEGTSEELTAAVVFHEAKEDWFNRARRLSWMLMGTALYNAAVCWLFGLGVFLFDFSVSHTSTVWLSALAVPEVLLCFIAAAMKGQSYHQILDVRKKYDRL
jgi:hypothetical protein